MEHEARHHEGAHAGVALEALHDGELAVGAGVDDEPHAHAPEIAAVREQRVAEAVGKRASHRREGDGRGRDGPRGIFRGTDGSQRQNRGQQRQHTKGMFSEHT